MTDADGYDADDDDSNRRIHKNRSIERGEFSGPVSECS